MWPEAQATAAGNRSTQLTEAAKGGGAGGLIWAKRTDAGWEGQGVKVLGAGTLDAIDADVGDLLVAVVGPDAITNPALHAVRNVR